MAGAAARAGNQPDPGRKLRGPAPHADRKISSLKMGIRYSSLAAASGAALAASLALGVFAAGAPPSARALAGCVAVYGIAPLFAPAPSDSGMATLASRLLWCGALTLLAMALAAPAKLLAAMPATAAVLFVMLAVSHFLLAALTRARIAGHTARWILFTAQALALTAPLWLAPLAELRGGGSDLGAWVVASSPLSHLASAAGCDYLRAEWFYRHAALGGMRFEYPPLVTVLAVYATFAVVLAFFTSRPLQEQTR